MRRHAKASTAGSTQRQAGRLGRFVRGVLAARGASGDFKGSSAPAAKRLLLPACVFVALIALMVFAIPAGAAKVHQLTSSFGVAGSGSGQFSANQGIAVDQADGSVYVVDSGNFRVQKFNAAGAFVLTFGKGVNQTNPGDVCTAVSGDTCKAGTQGSGGSGFDTNGGFSNPTFVAVDPINGDVYVADSGTSVVNKFSSAGAFLSSNDGSGSGSAFGALAGIAVDSARNLWVYDTNAQMREFDNTGAFVTQWNSGFGVSPFGIAVDSATNLYIVRGSPFVQRVSSTGTNLGEVTPNAETTSVTVDPATDDVYVGAGAEVRRFAGGCATPCTSVESFGAGDIVNAAGVAVRGSSNAAYVSDPGKPGVEIFDAVDVPGLATDAASSVGSTTARLNGTVNPEGILLDECEFEYGSTSSYGSAIPCAESPATIGAGSSPVSVHADISGLTPGATYHYRLVASYVSNANKGQGADRSFETASPPVISSEFSSNVVFTEAILNGLVNPKEGAPTTYHFEWGLDTSYGHSTPENGLGFSDSSNHPVSAALDGLAPDTDYHWRIVATNPIGVAKGADHVLTTYEVLPPDASCPNQQLRSGPSASLPDCRAYEMVSPVDKEGGDVVPPIGAGDLKFLLSLDQSSNSGEKFTYGSYRAFGDSVGAPYTNQFMASRGTDGWANHAITPSRGLGIPTIPLITSEFKAFSPDLSTAWVFHNADPPLAPGAVENYINLYKRDNLGESFEALTVTEPPNYAANSYIPEFQGASSDGSHAIFRASDALTPDAPNLTNEKFQLYEWFNGKLRLVSILPNGEPFLDESSAGTWNTALAFGAVQSVDHAISEDGSRIFWSGREMGSGGKLYVRIDGQTTVPVSESVSAADARFWTASVDGSKAIFSINETGSGSDLYEFEVATETPTLIAHEVSGLLGASDDASYVYLVSREDLDSGATAGEPNLYLYHEGSFSFIATITDSEANSAGSVPADITAPPSVTAAIPVSHFSRVTPAGHSVAFVSARSLTGYDNVDAATGKAAAEVYVYDADSGQLTCASCNPSGARPVAKPFDVKLAAGQVEPYFAAAIIRGWKSELYDGRALSDDGSRLFFESFDALVPQDTNSAIDVYEWEANGVGSCQKAGGCVSLISTGKSAADAEFVDASPSGDDVFIRTLSSIDPRDPGLLDMYDARVGGGFPLPAQSDACAGDGCQSAPEPPNDPTPASASFRGVGNPAPRKARRRDCAARKRHAKGKRQAKSKHTKHTKRCKRANRRTGR